MNRKLSDQEYLYDMGDNVLFENSNGTLSHVHIIRRLYEYTVLTYQIRYIADSFGVGVPCSQKWLRPLIRTKTDIRRYAKQHSPAYVHR